MEISEVLERLKDESAAREAIADVYFDKYAEVSASVMALLAQGPVAKTLRRIDFSPFSEPHGTAPFLPLLTADFPALRVCLFSDAHALDETELRALAGATFTKNLEALEVYFPGGQDTLVAALPLTGLRKLSVGDEGMSGLAANPHLAQLRHLVVHHVSELGVIELSNATSLHDLEHLELRGGKVGGAGLVALLRSRELTSLRKLEIRLSDLGDVSSTGWHESLFATGRFAPRLEELTLGEEISDTMARALVAHAPPTIRKLSFTDHRLSTGCVEELMRRAVAKGLVLAVR